MIKNLHYFTIKFKWVYYSEQIHFYATNTTNQVDNITIFSYFSYTFGVVKKVDNSLRISLFEYSVFSYMNVCCYVQLYT